VRTPTNCLTRKQSRMQKQPPNTPDPQGDSNPQGKPLISPLIAILPASRIGVAYDALAKVERDVFDHGEMTSIIDLKALVFPPGKDRWPVSTAFHGSS
jgi:hypothetical protein